MREMMMSEDERVSPDTYGCDCVFLRFFLTPAMEDDFPLIAKDFLQHEYVHLQDYSALRYVNDDPNVSWPERSFQYMILNLMMGAVKQDNEYAKSLFCYLHKTYYKAEYKLLKRFSTISASEVTAVAENPVSGTGPADIARVLSIAKMYGIQPQADCSFLYLYLEDFNTELEKEEEFDFVAFPEGMIEESGNILAEMYDDEWEMIRESDKIDRYIGKELRYFAYPKDYIDLCDDEFFGCELNYKKALSLMKMIFPNKKFDKKDIVSYAAIFRCISAVTGISSRLYELFKETLDISRGDFFDVFPPLFQPDEIHQVIVKPKPQSQPIQLKTTEKLQYNEQPIYKEKALLAEIDMLRVKLHKQEEETKLLRNQLRDSQKKLSEQEGMCKHSEEVHQELAALREHVYNFTECDTYAVAKDIEKMKAEVAAHDIVIIGGHDNWVKKLKQEFPSWVFISSKASGAVDNKLVFQGKKHILVLRQKPKAESYIILRFSFFIV